MEAVDAFWNPLHRLLRDLERYAVLPPARAPYSALSLQSASVHLDAGRSAPVVEVMETGTMVHVTVELSNPNGASIDVCATPHALRIRVGGKRDGLHVALPSRVRVESLRATERNGVLDLSMEKDVGPNGLGTEDR